MGTKVWEVIGGAKSGGIVVREGQKLASAELPERLAVGALIAEESLVGERLQFRLLSGTGPAAGWVSLKLKGADLLAPYQEPPPRLSGGPEEWGEALLVIPDCEMQERFSWADAMGEVLPEFGYESPHKDDPEWKMEKKRAFKAEWEETRDKVKDKLGKWQCLIPAKVSAFSGPLHLCCLCCAETGHLTPLMRIARACCVRETVGRVTFMSNTFGASKVAKWFEADPDPTGKFALYSFEDGWTESLQTQCNWFAQNEDGSLLGISNMGISKYCAALLMEVLCGKPPVSAFIQDMASSGYSPTLTLATYHPLTSEISKGIPKICSAPATILGAFIFKDWGPTLIHCFMAPQLMPMLAAVQVTGTDDPLAMKPSDISLDSLMSSAQVALPPDVRAVGIIADEAKASNLPQHLVDFLENGGPVVYVSMGSVATFSEEQLAKVCEGLKAPAGEWRVIWSLRAAQQELLPPGGTKALGENFLVSAWLPQAELLMHKKVGCFVSHCGWGATCEAIISGTPVVAFPMFADQNANAMLMNILGMAKTLTVPKFEIDVMQPEKMHEQMSPLFDVSTRLRNNFTAEQLREDIAAVLTQKDYLTGAKRARSMNFMYKGGAHKAAEEVETFCYQLNPNLRALSK